VRIETIGHIKPMQPLESVALVSQAQTIHNSPTSRACGAQSKLCITCVQLSVAVPQRGF
jgi:hypothetical protein